MQDLTPKQSCRACPLGGEDPVATIPASGGLKMDYGTAINDRDEIVGWGESPTDLTILKYADGVLVDLVPLIDNAEHWDFGSGGGPTGINERGEISGFAYYDDGSGLEYTHGYILVPNE